MPTALSFWTICGWQSHWVLYPWILRLVWEFGNLMVSSVLWKTLETTSYFIKKPSSQQIIYSENVNFLREGSNSCLPWRSQFQRWHVEMGDCTSVSYHTNQYQDYGNLESLQLKHKHYKGVVIIYMYDWDLPNSCLEMWKKIYIFIGMGPQIWCVWGVGSTKYHHCLMGTKTYHAKRRGYSHPPI